MAVMRVGIDVGGGDSPEATQLGALMAAAREDPVQVVAYGRRDALIKVSEAHDQSYGMFKVQIVESNTQAGAMMAITRDLLSGALNAWVTPTRSPKLLGALGIAKMYNKGVTLALMAPLPSENQAGGGGLSFLMDAGFTDEVHDPEIFVQWAEYGSRFLAKHYNINEPRIALYNISVERGAGSLKKIHKRLQGVGGYIGYAEPKPVVAGEVDLWLAEGFVGNGVIKVLEGWFDLTAKRVMRRFSDGRQAIAHEIGQVFKSELSYDAALISPVIGLKGDVAVCRVHGAATAEQVAASIAAVGRYLR